MGEAGRGEAMRLRQLGMRGGERGLIFDRREGGLQQQLVTREHRKETKRRRRSNATEEAPDAGLGDLVEDAAGLPKAFLHSYCCLDYARLIEVAQLRLALLRRHLKEQVQDK